MWLDVSMDKVGSSEKKVYVYYILCIANDSRSIFYQWGTLFRGINNIRNIWYPSEKGQVPADFILYIKINSWCFTVWKVEKKPTTYHDIPIIK